MKKARALLVAVFVVALVGGYQAREATASNGATVTKATFDSYYIDENGVFYPAVCDETQVINKSKRKETFYCTFTDAKPAPVIVTEENGFWFSDFDGAQAVDFQFVITPSGNMNGWAVY